MTSASPAPRTVPAEPCSVAVAQLDVAAERDRAGASSRRRGRAAAAGGRRRCRRRRARRWRSASGRTRRARGPGRAPRRRRRPPRGRSRSRRAPRGRAGRASRGRRRRRRTTALGSSGGLEQGPGGRAGLVLDEEVRHRVAERAVVFGDGDRHGTCIPARGRSPSGGVLGRRGERQRLRKRSMLRRSFFVGPSGARIAPEQRLARTRVAVAGGLWSTRHSAAIGAADPLGDRHDHLEHAVAVSGVRLDPIADAHRAGRLRRRCR